MCAIFFVELKVVGSFGSTEASAREFFDIEGSWGFGIDGSKCMCACVCVCVYFLFVKLKAIGLWVE